MSWDDKLLNALSMGVMSYPKLTALVLAAFVLGFVACPLAYDFFPDVFNRQVVARDQYQTLRQEHKQLREALQESREKHASRAADVCKWFAQGINHETAEQAKTMQTIQQLTSFYWSSGTPKDDDRRQSDERKAADLRRYSEALNDRLKVMYAKFAECK